MELKVLVGKLRPKMTTDLEIGYNQAIIELLKEHPLIQQGKNDKLKEAFSRIGLTDYFYALTDAHIEVINEKKAKASKLECLKAIKDFTGCSLKEGKDVVDFYWE